MSTLITKITTAKTTATLARDYERSTSSSRADVQAVADLLQSVISGGQYGGPSVVVSVREAAVRASGTFTLTSVVATNTCTVNGVTFTAIASGAGANQFNVGASDTETAANLAASINASVTALVAGYVTATSALTVVTVSSADYGIFGNQATITGTTNIVASGGRLTLGAADAGAKTYTF